MIHILLYVLQMLKVFIYRAKIKDWSITIYITEYTPCYAEGLFYNLQNKDTHAFQSMPVAL